MNGGKAGRINPWLSGALALAILPFLVVRYPPLTDYPAHLAGFAVMLGQWREQYDFGWLLTGNIGTDLLALPLGSLLGVERAGFLITAAILPLTALGIFMISKALGRPNGIGALLALPCIFSLGFQFGFLNYSWSIALALIGFALWIGTSWPRWVFAPMALAVWLFHVSGWGVFCLMVGGYELSRTQSVSLLIRRLWPVALPALLVLRSTAPTSAIAKWSFANKAAAAVSLFSERSLIFDVACLIAFVFLVYWILRSRRGSLDARCALPAALLFLAFLFLPPGVGGGDLADARLFAPAAILFFLSLTWQASTAWRAAVLGFFALRMILVTVHWYQDHREIETAAHAFDRISPGARILAIGVRTERQWGTPRFTHIASYAAVRKGALTNSNFMNPGFFMIWPRKDEPFLQRGTDVTIPAGRSLDLRALDLRCCDYLVATREGREDILLPGSVEIIFRSDHVTIARRR